MTESSPSMLASPRESRPRLAIRLPELNLILLNGRLTRDPELFFTNAGAAKCSFSIAVNRRVKDAKTGEWKDETFFMPIVVWREQAERCKEKLAKGSPVSVEGRLRARDFEDKTGQKRTVLEVEARRVQFLAASGSSEGSEGSGARPAAKNGATASSGESASAGADLEEVPF